MIGSVKYFLIAIANMAILTLLLAIWTDDLEMLFNGSVRPNEFIKIIGFTFLSIIGMRILVHYFRKNKIYETRKKIKYAAILTLIICSLLHVTYSINILQNRVLNATTRQRILGKMENSYESKVDSLSFEEYNEIAKMNWFPEIPESAENVSVDFYNDGFLPDFSVNVTCEVPLTEKIAEMQLMRGQYSKSIFVEVIGDHKKVHYSEGEW